MNFIKINVRISIIFLGLLIFLNQLCYSEMPVNIDDTGIPLIQKFPFPNSILSSGKFSVYEDSSGIFLIGTRNKLLVFYGNEFISLKLKGQINVISNQKSVFYAGYNSLGLIKLYKNNQPQLIPILDEKIKSNTQFGQINKVFVTNGLIIFNNEKKLYKFDGNDFSLIDSSKTKLQLFRVLDTVYMLKFETGLLKFIEGNLTIVTNGNYLAGKEIESILPFRNSLLIKCTGNSSFLKLDKKGIIPYKFSFDEFIEKAGFSDAIIIPGNKLAIATKSAGIIIYDFNTKTLRNIGIDEGLLDNNTCNLHIDKAGNLWVLHNTGFSRIELNIPVTSYGHFAGISGKVNDIAVYNENIYLATSNGLLKSGISDNPKQIGFNHLFFRKVDGIINECINVRKQGNYLLATTPTGIYKIEINKATLLYKDDIKCIAKSSFGNGYFLYGNEQGVSLLKHAENKFELIGTNKLDGCPITEISAEHDTVWLKTACNKLLMVMLNNIDSFSSRKYLSQGKYEGLPSEKSIFHILKTEQGVRFCYPDSIFKYSKSTGKFESEEVLDLKHLKGIPWLVWTLTDHYSNKWFHLSSSIENLQGVLMYKAPTEKSIERPVFFNTGSINSPIVIDSSTVWIGGDNKLLKFENNKTFNLQRSFSAIIKRIIIGKDSVLQIGLEDPEINYNFNHIKFDVSSTCFEGEPNLRYQYQLEGYNRKWSNWGRESVFRFNKLSPGKYIFKVRVLNVDGIVSGETNLKFYILHPFYQTIPAYIVYFLVILFITFILLRWRTWLFFKDKEKVERIVMERTEEILKEKEKSEILIANLLPKGTADELKSTGKATSQKFAMATVLFSDIQGFTKIAEQMNPELLIDQLDAFFFHFDLVVEKYNIEKIKTIGDAYMCAGGIPNKNITNPVEVVLAALEMQEYMRELKSTNADIWDLRIGIHTGSVIAGVVGHKKLSYDIWGDTVNTASRMESSGEAGKVNISGHTYELTKDFFICEHRGKMPVKYKGEIDMYFVKGIRPELAVDMRYIPNNKFFIMLQLLRIHDVEEDVFEKFEKEKPEKLYFHNFERIRDIYNLVDLFGRAEGLSDEENLLLRTAAILHDVGYLWDYENHEDRSISFSRELLPRYRYNQEQIGKIIELIDVTKRMRKPQNKSEEILLDADMNYLGRADYITLNDAHFKEMNELGKANSKEEWNNMQVVLLSNHKFYSHVANVLRDVSPEQQVENLLDSLRKSD